MDSPFSSMTPSLSVTCMEHTEISRNGGSREALLRARCAAGKFRDVEEAERQFGDFAALRPSSFHSRLEGG